MKLGATLRSPQWGNLFGRAKQAFADFGPRLSHPTTGILLAVMIVGGVVLRIWNVGYPFHTTFDEIQYIESGHQFMIGGKDPECCHPPLFKLIFGAGLVLLGNNPEGWRYMPLVFGLQSIVLAFLMARSLFRDERAGWLAAAFMAADGFYLTYSRAALGDILLSSFVQWSVFAAVVARGWGGALTSALLVGLAASIKWVGLLAGLPACFAILLLRRARWYTIFAFAIVPVVHLVVWMFGLYLIHLPNDPISIVETIIARKNFHLGFVHHKHPLESAWYTWLVMYHPIVVKSAHVAGKVRVASSVSHPLLAVSFDACLVALPVLASVAAFNLRWRERWKGWFDAHSSKALAILGVAWLSSMALWMNERIVTYWYHWLTSWGFGIILVGGVVSIFDRRHPKAVFLFVLFALLISIWFAPVWAEIPMSQANVNRRLVFPLWR
jgi:dolichyl-phosphate-mannose--protein O-mannosyl transferase